MNCKVVLLLIIYATSNACAKPYNTYDADDTNTTEVTIDFRNNFEQIFGTSMALELRRIMECAPFSNYDKFEEFQADVISRCVGYKEIVSKAGTDEFDIDEYRKLCTKAHNNINEFWLFMGNEYKKCVDGDKKEIVDLVVDFIKELGDYECNLSGDVISYFDPDFTDEWIKCAKEIQQKIRACLVEVESNSVSDEGNINNTVCKNNFTTVGVCVKNAVSEYKEIQARGIILKIDFLWKYLEKKLDCSSTQMKIFEAFSNHFLFV